VAEAFPTEPVGEELQPGGHGVDSDGSSGRGSDEDDRIVGLPLKLNAEGFGREDFTGLLSLVALIEMDVKHDQRRQRRSRTCGLASE
jgi:hypothetical protein